MINWIKDNWEDALAVVIGLSFLFFCGFISYKLTVLMQPTGELGVFPAVLFIIVAVVVAQIIRGIGSG